MKKENVVKNILTKSLSGFPIGVTLLMIAYISIYFIVGENVFIYEIRQLQNIKILIVQMVLAGVSGYLTLVNFCMMLNLQKKEEEYMRKHPNITIVASLTVSLIFTVIVFILVSANVFSENLKVINGCMLILAYVLEGILLAIMFTKQSNLIKKINQKLREKNL